jgi:hypothetical protein
MHSLYLGGSGVLRPQTTIFVVNIHKRSAMSESDDLPKPERIPFFQRVLENPFLLLFIGIAMPTVFYVLWGVMEIATLPIAP